MKRLLAVTSVVVMLASCSPAEESTGTTALPPSTSTTTTTPATSTTEPADFSVSSSAFDDGDAIPVQHTCDGLDVSPDLRIRGLPETTRAIAIVVEDPDAPLGIWYHWVEFDIPASSGSFDVEQDAGRIGVSGLNSWNLEGYMGPCPPEGEEHRYAFRVYALSSTLGLPDGVDAEEVVAALVGHVIDSVELTGVYSR